jgi:hypothetical protein
LAPSGTAPAAGGATRNDLRYVMRGVFWLLARGHSGGAGRGWMGSMRMNYQIVQSAYSIVFWSSLLTNLYVIIV